MHTLLWVFIVGLGSGVLFHCFCMRRGRGEDPAADWAAFRASHPSPTPPETPPDHPAAPF